MIISLNKDYKAKIIGDSTLGRVGEMQSRTVELQGYILNAANAYKLVFEYSDSVKFEVDISKGKYNVDASILRIPGQVNLQVIAINTNGDLYTYVKKSNVVQVKIGTSISDDVAPIPPYELSKSIADRVIEADTNCKDYAEQAQQYKYDAMSFKDVAKEQAEIAKISIAQVQGYSETCRTAAQTATQKATEAVDAINEVKDTVTQVQQNTTDIALKLDKPSSEGTAGQVLALGDDNNPQWQDALTEIEDGTITPLKTTFFTKSDIEYEIVEGKKINANNIVADDNAFTVFIKIPSKSFAWISVTPSNTTYPFGSGTRTAGSLICDINKQSLGSYGFTDNNRNLCVLRGDKVKNHDGAAYFAVSYTLGTEFDIKIGGIDTHNDSEIPITSTEISNDFFVSGKNLIHDLCNVQYAPSNDRWGYNKLKSTNFFEISNGKTYYHNGKYIYLTLFDEQYNYVGAVDNHTSGNTIQKDYDFKYAYAWSTVDGNINDSLWFADTDLSRDTYTPDKIVNPKYVDLNNIKRKQIKSWYNGKRVSFLGDSLTDSGTGGFYINYLNEYFGFGAITKSAKGGTFVSGNTTAFGAAFWQDERVNQLDLDSDIVFVMGGTNDANNNVSLGSPDISNCDTKTFYGAYHVLISKLIYKYYKLDTGYYAEQGIDYSGVTQADTAKPVQIFLITPPYMLDSERQYNKTPTYAEAVIEIGKLLGCPVCDTRANSGVNLYTREYYKGYRNGKYDYTHVSPEAHKQWTKVIIGKMLEVEPLESEVNE